MMVLGVAAMTLCASDIITSGVDNEVQAPVLAQDTLYSDSVAVDDIEQFNVFDTKNLISIIISIVMTLTAVIVGAKYYQKKEALQNLTKAILDAVQDNKISKEQLEKIIDLFKTL